MENDIQSNLDKVIGCKIITSLKLSNLKHFFGKQKLEKRYNLHCFNIITWSELTSHWRYDLSLLCAYSLVERANMYMLMHGDVVQSLHKHMRPASPFSSFLFPQVFFFIPTALLFQCTGKSKTPFKRPAWTRHSTRALEEKSQKTAIN
jgi:hypothetical protein